MNGVLPQQSIQLLCAQGAISAEKSIDASQIQPASLDLRLGESAYRVRASFLSGRHRSVEQRLDDFAMHKIDLRPGAVLEKGCVYVVPLLERLSLPPDLHGAANAKSSTGRLDLLTRLITDGSEAFDEIAPGYQGQLYAEICPRSFSVLVRPGMRLNQLRVRRGNARLTDDELLQLHQRSPLVDRAATFGGGLSFSVDLEPKQDNVAGFRAKPHTGVIDLDKINHYPVSAFWEKVLSEEGQIVLDPNAFYILVSREAVSIPPGYAAEMAPYLAMVGEFRVHYAGFFDPGFGYGPAGGAGARGVLEVRCHEAPFILEHGQSVGRLVFEKMCEIPKTLYGREIASNYQGQGLKLAKQFQDMSKTPNNP